MSIIINSTKAVCFVQWWKGILMSLRDLMQCGCCCPLSTVSFSRVEYWVVYTREHNIIFAIRNEKIKSFIKMQGSWFFTESLVVRVIFCPVEGGSSFFTAFSICFGNAKRLVLTTCLFRFSF